MFSHIHKKTARSSYEQPQQQQQVVMPIKMQFAYRQVPLQTVAKPVTNVVDANPLPKMKWGKPIWTFFHVMAQKLIPEYFNLVIKECLRFILLICGTLPCPVQLAQYVLLTPPNIGMRAINLNNIRCK